MELSFHWGTFVKAVPRTASNATSVQVCLEISETALRRFNFDVFDPADEAGDFAVAGSGPKPSAEVIVQIVCVPLDKINTWMIVSASSNDSALAEQTRNLVRKFILDFSDL
jgi:hypothetical protein